MRQDAKAKIFVGMLVSVVAFGFATGAGVFMNTNPMSTAGIMNFTQQSDFPSITTQPSNYSNTLNVKQNSSTSNQNSGQTKTNTNTNTPVSTNNNTKTPSKPNNTSTNSSG